MAENSGFGLETQKFTVSHAGKQHSYHLAFALKQLGKLEGFYTSSYVESAILQKMIAQSGNPFFARRYKEGLASPYVHSHWNFEFREMWMRKLQGKSLAVQNQVYKRDTDFDLMIAAKIPSIASSHFWGFQGSCHASLKAAKQADKIAVCELATAHVVQAKKILAEEARLQPDWADSIDNLYFPPEYEKRLEEEPFLADHVIAASKFTEWTLKETGIDPAKISVLPLGFEADKIPFQLSANGFSKRPLRLLFAGTVTQRKGISYLLDAMETLPESVEVELHIIGGIQGSGNAFSKRKHLYCHYPAVSQQEMFQKYQEFDALILPTVFEGFGLVIVEALAAGIPVITTPHSMGPDVISEGKNGWIIPIRDSVAIANAMVQLRDKSDDEFAQMKLFSRSSALEFTWERYSQNLAEVTKSLI